MAQVVVAGVSGAAGVSATALGLAAWWPGSGAVAVECDPSGGNAAARWGVGLRPGLVECTAAAEVGGSFSDPLKTGTQWLSVAGRETAVVCAPPGGRQVATALPLLGPPSKALDPADGTAVVDIGRLWAASPAWPLCESTDLLLVIAPASVAGIAHLRAHLVPLVPQRVGATLVALAGGEYAADEVAGAVADIEGVEVAGELPPPGAIYRRPGGLRGRGDHRRWDAFTRTVAERLASVPKAAIGAGPGVAPMAGDEAVLVAELTERAREWMRGRLDGEARAVDRASLTAEAVETVLREHTGQRLMDAHRPLEATVRNRLAKEVTARLLGTGGLAKLLEDDQIEDIWCNGADNVWVRYRDGSISHVEPVADSDAALLEMVRSIAAAGGGAEQERRFDRAAPILDLQLPGGARLNAVMAVSRRPAVSIRRHRHLQVGLDELVRLGTITGTLASFLATAIQARCNIVVAGETGAGKTTLLRALCSVLPFEERIVTIEDSFELGLDADAEGHGNVVAMQARAANLEGAGEVGLGQLFRAGLRMNPSRVIVGEVRGAEIIQMLHAMSQGNDGSLSTIHASSSEGAASKLALYALEASPQLTETAVAKLIGEAVDLIVHMKLGPDQVRRVTSVREIKGADSSMVVSNELFRAPHPAAPAVASVPPSKALADRLAAAGWAPERGRVG